MYHDEIFENALNELKEESYNALKEEISTMEMKIDHFLKKFFESTSFRSERDYNMPLV